VVGVDALENWGELLRPTTPTSAVQPRVMYGASLEHLRALAGMPVEWRVRTEGEIDVLPLIEAQFPR
jgi:hypothetical protein